MLTLSAFQLFYGKLYTFFSVKWIFMMAIFWFEIGSAICGSAVNSTALIVGRAIAGFGSAGIFSGALLIIAASAPLSKRPTYIGILGAMYGIASVTGPLMVWRFFFFHMHAQLLMKARVVPLRISSPGGGGELDLLRYAPIDSADTLSFYINLPLGAVTVIFILVFYRESEQSRAQMLNDGWKARLSQFDLEGLAIFLPMVGGHSLGAHGLLRSID